MGVLAQKLNASQRPIKTHVTIIKRRRPPQESAGNVSAGNDQGLNPTMRIPIKVARARGMNQTMSTPIKVATVSGGNDTASPTRNDVLNSTLKQLAAALMGHSRNETEGEDVSPSS